MLSDIQEKLDGLVRENWASVIGEWGDGVESARKYIDGEHPGYLSAEMRAMLRSSGFADNYCDLIVQTMTDRLAVAGLDANDDTATAWASDVLADNRFDGLQLDVHDSAVGDGDTFVLVEYDPARGVVLSHEPAFDGDKGMIPVYDRTRSRLVAAVKIWYEVAGRRINIYYPDRVEKYTAGGTGGAGRISLMASETWAAGVVPVVHFRNRQRRRAERGVSEIAAAIPLQDALNRTIISMVMTGELSAFQVYYMIGAPAPAAMKPGMWVTVGEDGIDRDMVAPSVGVLPAAQMGPFIEQASFLIDQIGTITMTPFPTVLGGDNQSGEALKQRQVGLLGKVGKAQTRFGNAWENVIDVAVAVQNAYGSVRVPEGVRWSCRWVDAQIRNDTEVIDNALKIADRVGEREFLRAIAGVYGWDERRIEAILEQRGAENAAALSALGGSLPGFENFGL